MDSSKPPHACPICGGVRFGPGPKGRAAPDGSMPRCEGCGSLERHRAFRLVLSALSPVFAGASVLQFSEDQSAPRQAFGRFEVSDYGGDNSLDMAAVDRPDGAYDLVIANHVLEHVADDRAALAELARIGRATFLSVPDLLRVERTVEYGRAREDKHGHYRLYGPDIADRWRAAVPGWGAVGVVGRDPVTGAEDRATVLSHDEALLAAVTAALHAAGYAPFKAL